MYQVIIPSIFGEQLPRNAIITQDDDLFDKFFNSLNLSGSMTKDRSRIMIWMADEDTIHTLLNQWQGYGPYEILQRLDNYSVVRIFKEATDRKYRVAQKRTTMGRYIRIKEPEPFVGELYRTPESYDDKEWGYDSE